MRVTQFAHNVWRHGIKVLFRNPIVHMEHMYNIFNFLRSCLLLGDGGIVGGGVVSPSLYPPLRMAKFPGEYAYFLI